MEKNQTLQVEVQKLLIVNNTKKSLECSTILVIQIIVIDSNSNFFANIFLQNKIFFNL